MRPNPGTGKLIALEGLDGAGTTTQSNLLAYWLRRYKGERVHVTREPSQGPAGVQIRSVLNKRLTMDSRTLAALFVTDRLDHLYNSNGVIKRLENGEWVIMDRYYLSSFAYQALSLDAQGLQWLRDLHEPCLIPDVTFLLDVPIEECLKRIASNRDFHFELFEKKDVLEKVYLQYLDAIQRFRREGQNIQIVEGAGPAGGVGKAIRDRLKKMFWDPACLSEEEQQALWREWEVLGRIRQGAEERLGLYLLTVKRLPKSPRSRGGGYQLALANRLRIYYVAGFLDENRATMSIMALGKADDTLQHLEAICRPYAQTPSQTLPLWNGG